MECYSLNKLGRLYQKMMQPDEALYYFETALELTRRLGSPGQECSFLSNLGLLHAQEGRVEAARNCLDTGQPLLLAINERIDLGMVYCVRAEAAYLTGDRAAAEAAITHAEQIAAAMDAKPDWELRIELSRVRALCVDARGPMG